MEEYIEKIKQKIVEGKYNEIENLVQVVINDRVDLGLLINDAMIGAMEIVGQRFSQGKIFVPEMLVSALTMKKGLEIVKPLIKQQEITSRGTIMMCTVKGDIHDIGKNLVVMMLEGAGFNVVDLGVDLSVEQLVRKVEEVKPQILGLSALLTTTMSEMEKVIQALKHNGLRDHVKVMVGGAPIDAAFSQKIGADGYGKDASEAVQLSKTFLSS